MRKVYLYGHSIPTPEDLPQRINDYCYKHSITKEEFSRLCPHDARGTGVSRTSIYKFSGSNPPKTIGENMLRAIEYVLNENHAKEKPETEENDTPLLNFTPQKTTEPAPEVSKEMLLDSIIDNLDKLSIDDLITTDRIIERFAQDSIWKEKYEQAKNLFSEG